MHDYTVKDSSLWQTAQSERMASRRDSIIRTGIVRQVFFDDREGEKETKYIVDVIDPGGQYTVMCRRMYDFGGVFNYEEYTYQTYQEKTDGTGKGDFKTRPGDTVLMAYIGGDEKEGVIIGALKHPARKESLEKASEDLAFAREFNGVETTINKDGEWKLRFRGIPTNIDILSNPPTEDEIAPAEYDEEMGNSFISMSKDGSLELSDAATEKPQGLKIDKTAGTVTVTSGSVTLVMDKEKETYKVTCKETSFESSEKFSIKTKEYNLESQKINIKASKIKQQGDLDHTGGVKLKGSAEIAGPTDIKGSLSTSGATALGGGGAPLINQILLIMGTGNKGLPVISTATVLQTALTTAG